MELSCFFMRFLCKNRRPSRLRPAVSGTGANLCGCPGSAQGSLRTALFFAPRAGKFSVHNRFCLRGMKNYVILPALTRRASFLCAFRTRPPKAACVMKEGLNG